VSIVRALAPLLLAILAAFFLASRAPFWQSDMEALLPPDAALPLAEQRLLQARETAQNRQLLLLVGAARPLPLAERLRDDWLASGLFVSAELQRAPLLETLRDAYRHAAYRVLPPAARQQLRDDPAAYFRDRTEALINPFAVAVLPPDADWPGFSRYFPPTLAAAWQPDADGLLSRELDGKRWLLLRATLNADSGILGDPRLLALLARSEQEAKALSGETHVAGAAIFAAAGRASGEAESRWMSILGAALTLTLALAVFRRLRVLLIALPMACGLLGGLAATVALCGNAHLLTLVIGSSLIGLLLDFPLHWLGKSTLPGWQPYAALAALRRPFFISLLITLAGYAFLLATPLPILRQTAVFALVALPLAWLTTLWTLPPLFRHYLPRANPHFAAGAVAVGRSLQRLRQRRLLVPAAFIVALLLWHSDWQDDIRQWISLPPHWLQQAQAAAQIGGVEPAAQQFLIHAPDDDTLLQRDAALAARLENAKAGGALQDYSAISQWVWRHDEQQAMTVSLRALASRPEAWQALTDAGVAPDTIAAALRAVAAPPVQTVAAQLANPLAARWQGLYVGRQDADGAVYSSVALYGVRDSAALAALADGDGIRYLDRRARLNALFATTRSEALWLKLASYLVAFIILRAAAFSPRDSLKILAVPLAAAVLTVAVFSALGLPLSLFAAFGLLLTSALGVDYAVYAQSVGSPATTRFCGMLLAALTTVMSFGILAFSSTPAVAAFGLCVALGIAFSLAFATWLLPPLSENIHGNS
jgi:Predicted exporter